MVLVPERRLSMLGPEVSFDMPFFRNLHHVVLMGDDACSLCDHGLSTASILVKISIENITLNFLL